MEFFERPGSILIVAKSASGKTTLISNICAHLKQKKLIHGILIFSSTAKFNDDYPFVDKEKYVFKDLDMKLLTYIMATREKKKREGGQVKNLLCILDDVVGDKEIRSKDFEALISKARHFNMYIIISVQHINVIPPIVRQNANSVAVTKIDNKIALKYMYELCGWRGEMSDFDKMMQNDVGLYEWFVANRCSASKKIEDQFRIIKTTNQPVNFKYV